VKTTGGKGIHVVVSIARKYTWDQIKAFSRAIAMELARAEPKQYVAVAAKDQRKGRIFVDYLRNSRGATAVAPYPLRARAGATLSMPVTWKQLEKLDGGGHFHLEAGKTWKKPAGPDPWADFFTSAQTLPRGATSL
jgi:bifunctional non-homologous end joining protein LigD